MYNRYIPQPDGTYRRNRVQEPSRGPMRQRPAPPPKADEPPCPPPAQEICPEPAPVYREQAHPRRPPKDKPGGSALGFLKNLLPQDFDTGDLLIVLLLLLMAGDSAEEQNSALLTLALYLFM